MNISLIILIILSLILIYLLYRYIKISDDLTIHNRYGISKDSIKRNSNVYTHFEIYNDYTHHRISNDLLIGGISNDYTHHGISDDSLIEEISDDYTHHRISNDLLIGGISNDYTHHRIGNDSLIEGISDDSLIGGKKNNSAKMLYIYDDEYKYPPSFMLGNKENALVKQLNSLSSNVNVANVKFYKNVKSTTVFIAHKDYNNAPLNGHVVLLTIGKYFKWYILYGKSEAITYAVSYSNITDVLSFIWNRFINDNIVDYIIPKTDIESDFESGLLSKVVRNNYIHRINTALNDYAYTNKTQFTSKDIKFLGNTMYNVVIRVQGNKALRIAFDYFMFDSKKLNDIMEFKDSPFIKIYSISKAKYIVVDVLRPVFPNEFNKKQFDDLLNRCELFFNEFTNYGYFDIKIDNIMKDKDGKYYIADTDLLDSSPRFMFPYFHTGETSTYLNRENLNSHEIVKAIASTLQEVTPHNLTMKLIKYLRKMSEDDFVNKRYTFTKEHANI